MVHLKSNVRHIGGVARSVLIGFLIMPLKDLHIIDPFSIEDKDCPVFVQTGDMRSFFGWGIRKRTKSNWNHSMVLYRKGLFATQSWTFKTVDIKEYMKPGQILKFWVCQDITPEERTAIIFKTVYELKKKWYKRMYDVPGVIGQLFGLRWINIPGLNYCSERVANLVKVIIQNVGKHPTPEDIDTLFKGSDRMAVIGFYIGL